MNCVFILFGWKKKKKSQPPREAVRSHTHTHTHFPHKLYINDIICCGVNLLAGQVVEWNKIWLASLVEGAVSIEHKPHGTIKDTVLADLYTDILQCGFRTNFVQIDSSDNWESASISLRRSGYQIKMGHTEAVVIAEKYSRELSVCPY